MRLLFYYFVAIVAAVTSAGAATPAGTYSLQKQPGYVENKGQILDQYNVPNTSVRYLLNRPGLNIQLKANGFSYDSYIEKTVPLKDKSTVVHQPNERQRESYEQYFHRVDVELVGANPAPIIRAIGASDDYQNYYTTGLGEEGVTNVRNYARIVYGDIYPHIDLEFFQGKQGEAEYQFIIHPGGDASRIRLQYKGATSTTLSGNLIKLTLRHGSITEHIPKSYMAESGREINVRFQKIGMDMYGYSVPNYLLHQTLVIDPTPTFTWGTYYGGNANDFGGFALTTDKSGNVYVTGRTGSANGIATSGAHQTTIGGNEDAFIASFSLDGSCRWSTYFGGNNQDGGYGIATDNLGNIFITGETWSTNAIATIGAHQTVYTGYEDVFIASFTTGGTRRWSTYYGGLSGDVGFDIAISPNGNLLIAGGTFSSTGIATAGAYKTTQGGTDDGFIASFSATGILQWGTYYGGNSHDGLSGIAVDYNGNVFAIGETSSTSGIAAGSPIHQANFNSGIHDAFLVKFTSGGSLLWGTYFGGSSSDLGNSIAVDGNGAVFFAGYTKSTSAIATMGAHQPSFSNSSAYDAFLAKFSNDGVLLWGTYYGDSGDDGPGSITLDKDGHVYIAGFTNSTTSLFSTSNAFQNTSHGNYDAFIAQFNTEGNRIWGSYYGGSSEDRAWGIAVDTSGNIFITGSTLSPDNISSPGAFQVAKSSGSDGFVTLLGMCNLSGTTISSNHSNTFCLNDGLNIQYSVANSPLNIYLWSNLRLGNIINSKTSYRITVNWTQAGTDTVRLRVESPGGCIKDTFLIITITPALIAQAGTDVSFCIGDSIVIGEDATGGSAPYYYSWLPKTGIIGATNTSSITVSPTETTDYTVMVTDVKGCYHEDLVRITVHPKPQIVAGADTFVCAGQGIKIGTIATGGTKEYTYKWSPTIGLNNPMLAQPIASPPADTTYQVIVTDINGCKDTSSIRIHVRMPNTVLLPQRLDFGMLSACTGDTIQTVTIFNSGNEDLLFTRQNSSVTDFTLIDTLPLGIAKGETKTVTIRYAPQSAQVAMVGTVTLTGSPCSYQVIIPVKGEKSESFATTNKPGINYGISLACKTGIKSDSTITIKNISSGPMTISGIRTSAPFAIISPQFPQTLPPQADLAITIRYAPSSVGVYSSDVELSFNSASCSDTIYIPLRAEHIIPSVKINANPLVFQDLLGCDPPRDTVITIDNPTSVDVEVVSIISSESQFKILTGLPFILPAHSNRPLIVRYDPTRNGLSTGTLTIVTNPCNQSVVIDLQASKQGISFAVADTLDVGEIISCAKSSATIQFTIENTSSGGASGGVTVVTPGASITTTLKNGETLPSGSPQKYDLTITPLIDGKFLDSMMIVFNPCGITKMVYVKGKRTNVMLKADFPTLDFGKIQSGTNKPLPATFTNTGTTALTVSSVPNLPAPFSILSIAPPLPAILQPNDKLTVTIQYTGTTGTQTSKLFAFATLPCAASDSIALKGEGEVSALPSFAVTKSLKTDSICIGKDTLLTVRLTNTGGVNLQVQQALASGSADFAVIGFTPQTLASGNSIDVQVRYAPTAVGHATGKVVWVTDLLRDSTDLSGLGKSCGILPIDTAKTTISISNIEANTGDKVQVNLKLTGEQGLTKSGATNFKAKIGFNRTILHITDPAIVCNSGTNADRCEVEITGTRQSGSDILAVIPAEATLGNTERTNLELLTFEWLNGTGFVSAARVNGELILTDICREGGVRLYQPTQNVSLSMVPNPASGNAEIKYTLREESAVRVSLVDVLGREVMIIDEAVRGAGTYRKSVELTNTGDGVYYLRLQAPNVLKTVRVSVVR